MLVFVINNTDSTIFNNIYHLTYGIYTRNRTREMTVDGDGGS